jgi:hypothetical protein
MLTLIVRSIRVLEGTPPHTRTIDRLGMATTPATPESFNEATSLTPAAVLRSRQRR